MKVSEIIKLHFTYKIYKPPSLKELHITVIPDSTYHCPYQILYSHVQKSEFPLLITYVALIQMNTDSHSDSYTYSNHKLNNDSDTQHIEKCNYSDSYSYTKLGPFFSDFALIISNFSVFKIYFYSVSFKKYLKNKRKFANCFPKTARGCNGAGSKYALERNSNKPMCVDQTSLHSND